MSNLEGVNFNDALEKLGGFGKFHYLLLLYMSPSNIAGVVIVNTLTYMMPAIACELKIPKFRQGFLFSAMYIGMISGGLISGTMSDAIGRRATLLILLSLTSFFEVVTIFTNSYWTLFFVKICSGFIAAGINTTYYTYASEFIRTRDKYKITMGVGMLTASGFFIEALIALFTIPIDKEYTIIPKVLIMNNWRIFQFICTLFPIAGFLFFLLLPESPAFLLRSGREKEAIEVLREIYVTNTNNPPETFDVQELYIEEESNQKAGVKQSFSYKLAILLSYPYVIVVTIVILCQFITMGAFAGIRAHLATIITMSLGIGQRTDVNVTYHQGQMLCKLFENQVIFRKKVDCSLGKVKLNSEIYIFTTIIGFFIFTSFLPMTALIKKLGQPFAFVALHYVGAACIVVMPFAQAYLTVFLLTVFSLCMQNCVTIAVSLILGRVPTIVRGLTVSLLLIGGRVGVILGDMILPVMTEFSCLIGFWSIAVLNLISLPLLLIYKRQPNPLAWEPKPEPSKPNKK